MKMNATLLFFEPSSSAKSFIDWSNVLEFWSKHIRNSGDIKVIIKKVKILLEIKMIQQFDILAELNKRVSHSIPERMKQYQMRLEEKATTNQQQSKFKHKTIKCQNEKVSLSDLSLFSYLITHTERIYQ
jgi:hypothetical protein